MSRLRTIRAVTPMQGYCLEVTWADGTRSTVDLSIGVSGAGVFAPLLDPVLFRAVRVGERARTIEWALPAVDAGPELVDIDADALFAMSDGAARGDAAASAPQSARV